MTNSKLVHYLNSGVKVKHNCYIVDLDIYNIKQITAESSTAEIYLYFISCLTALIPIDGEMKIPLVELAKIEGTYNGEDYIIENNAIKWNNSYSGMCFSFKYRNNSFKLYSVSNNDYLIVNNQLLLFQKLIERKINVFPKEIKSIDPRDLGENNPYKS